MVIFDLKAWQGSTWTSLLLLYYGARKVQLELFRVAAQKDCYLD